MKTVTSAAVGVRTRVESIDLLRGLVMILMALDHVRDYFGVAGNPTNPATASVALFFTRWITHLCAPTFFLLTGVSAWLKGQRIRRAELSRFLFIRGVWLIVLELTILRCLGYQFNFDYRVTLLIILWALGWAMIALAGLVHLGPTVAGIAGLALIAGHNLFDSVDAAALGAFAPFWSIVHVPNIIIATPDHLVFVAYPLVPWIGVTAAGFGLGQVFTWSLERRQKFLLQLGAALTAAFIVLRWINAYGDPLRWTEHQSGVRTMLSFLNTNKYPPSLLYLLMTLGPALLFLWFVEMRPARWLRPAAVFGRVPLFYFILHLPLIHLLAVVVCYARYGQAYWMSESPTLADYPFTRPPGWGYSLPVVYLIWIGVILGLYPLSRWFAGVKNRGTDAWLSYI